MAETTLFGLGLGVSFIFLAGAYVYLRESFFEVRGQTKVIPIRVRPTYRDQ